VEEGMDVVRKIEAAGSASGRTSGFSLVLFHFSSVSF
jgi:hypothetical protein